MVYVQMLQHRSLEPVPGWNCQAKTHMSPAVHYGCVYIHVAYDSGTTAISGQHECTTPVLTGKSQSVTNILASAKLSRPCRTN